MRKISRQKPFDYPDTYPLSYPELSAKQKADKKLQKDLKDNKRFKKEDYKFSDKTFQLILRDDKIVVPKSLQRRAAQWYYDQLLHTGETRMELTIGQPIAGKA